MPRKKASIKTVQTNFRLKPEVKAKLKKVARTWDNGRKTTMTVVVEDLIQGAAS